MFSKLHTFNLSNTNFLLSFIVISEPPYLDNRVRVMISVSSGQQYQLFILASRPYFISYVNI